VTDVKRPEQADALATALLQADAAGEAVFPEVEPTTLSREEFLAQVDGDDEESIPRATFA
jgi:hypothetical protein